VRRREFIAGLSAAVAAVSPKAAQTQGQAMPIVGNLATIAPASAIYFPDFKRAVADLGFAEGRDVAFDYRWPEGHPERLPGLADALVRERVALIASFSGLPTALAAKNATATIPIVFLISGDPVGLGLVSSFNRPGGNLTGVTTLLSDLVAKQLAFMHELLPNKSLLGVLLDPSFGGEGDEQTARTAGDNLGVGIAVAHAISDDQFEAAIASLARQQVGGLIVAGAALFATHHDQLATLATKYALPAIFPNGDLSRSGGLMVYGASLPAMFAQLGTYAGKILRGAKPADLPVLQPAKFNLVINLKAAKALGLTVPPSLLVSADEVIE
jgi:putative ABC transport system substrate-binding protein